MPRVVPNQKEKFETDEFMKRHSREGEVSNADKGHTLRYKLLVKEREREDKPPVVCPGNVLGGTGGFYNELHKC